MSAPQCTEYAQAEPDVRRETRRYKAFCAVIVLGPCLALLLAIPIARTDWIVRRSQDLYFNNLGYGLTLRQAGCDVVIYGDSSALTGVDPSVIQARTGLKTCNIAEYEGVFELFRLLVPDEFLHRNAAPRFMVMAFCPWNLAPYDRWADSTTFEAILFRVRMLPGRQAAMELAAHPAQTFDFLTRTLRMTASAAVHRELPAEMVRYRQEHHGFMPRIEPVLADCSRFSDRVREPDPAWIDAMRRRYANGTTRVLVDVTPLPTCAESYTFYADRLRSRTDNTLELWLPAMFNGSGHFMPAGSTRFSETIAQQIREAGRLQ